MDNKTLLIALGIIAISYTLFFGLLAFKRKEKSLAIFTAGYFTSIIVIFLTYFQPNIPIFFGVIILNLAYFLFLFFLSGGFKARYQLPLFSKSIYIIFLVFLVLFIVFTYIIPHFSIRIIISSLVSVVILYANYVDVHKIILKRAPAYAKIGSTIIVIYSIVAIFRIIYAIITFHSEGFLLEESSFTTISNMFIFISLNVWAMLIISIDYLQFVLKLKEQNELLAKIALKDALTNLYNRHYLEQEIDRYFQIAIAYHQPLSFILFDLDNFKIINDVYGHDYGDEVLKLVSKTVSENIRPIDIAFRWGGEEFLIICPNTLINDSYALAEKIRIAIKNTFISEKSQLTISLGITDFSENDSKLSWFKRVDYGLSQAKKTGKNKSVIWPKNKIIPEAFTSVEWHESWNSGSNELDLQHQNLIHQANKLAIIALDQNHKEKILDQIDLLINEAINHFKFEEKMLLDLGCPLYESHKKEHDHMIPQFQTLIEEVKADNISIKSCYDRIVGTFIIDHMLKFDKQFFPFLKEKFKS